MGGSKKTYEKIRYQNVEIRKNESDWFDRVLYTKDKIKKSSLKNGDGFGFDSQRLSLK